MQALSEVALHLDRFIVCSRKSLQGSTGFSIGGAKETESAEHPKAYEAESSIAIG